MRVSPLAAAIAGLVIGYTVIDPILRALRNIAREVETAAIAGLGGGR